MRKITKDACSAFNYNQRFSRGNTSVMVDKEKTYLILHGNTIAIKHHYNDSIKISHAGWDTMVTKERLNGLPNVNIIQKDFVWYLNGKKWSGNWKFI